MPQACPVPSTNARPSHQDNQTTDSANSHPDSTPATITIYGWNTSSGALYDRRDGDEDNPPPSIKLPSGVRRYRERELSGLSEVLHVIGGWPQAAVSRGRRQQSVPAPRVSYGASCTLRSSLRYPPLSTAITSA
jgi:hypothetical protein